MAVGSLQRRTYFRNPRTRVVINRQTHQSPLHQHRHEFLELAIVLSGEGVHVTGQFQHRIQTGDVLVISRLRPHGYERTQSLNLLNILIRENAMPCLARDLRHLPGYHSLFLLEALRWNRQSYHSRLRLNSTDLMQVSEWVNRLEEETLRPNMGGHVLAEAYLILIMGLLIRRYGHPSIRLNTRPEVRMGMLLSWVEMHLDEQLTVPLLARQAGMSLRSFHRSFCAAVCQTPALYLMRQRVARAKELLAADPSARISGVASKCGFVDSNYFSRIFRLHAKMTPRRYSRQCTTGLASAAHLLDRRSQCVDRVRDYD